MEEIRMALQLEEDGYAYYKKAAELCPNVYGKKMFEKLAKDEIKHLQIFKRKRKKFLEKLRKKEKRQSILTSLKRLIFRQRLENMLLWIMQ